jgi:hypothetical protein
MGGMKKVMSSLDFFTKRNDSVPELGAMAGARADNLLVVFDMDHTMVYCTHSLAGLDPRLL